MTISIRVLDNDRITAKGAARSNDGVALNLGPEETAAISVDWAGFLGEETISSYINDASAATVTGEAQSGKTLSLKARASGAAFIRQRITTSAGQIKELPIYINGGQLYARPQDYC